MSSWSAATRGFCRPTTWGYSSASNCRPAHMEPTSTSTPGRTRALRSTPACSPDQGALADRQGSAGTVAYFSPGLIVSATHDLQLYGFVQVPVYSELNGYQLFPRWTGSVGLSYAF